MATNATVAPSMKKKGGREEGGSNEAGFGATAGYRYHTGGWQPGLVGSGVLAAAESPVGAMQWGICFYFS